MKRLFIFIWLAVISAGIGYIFWYTDWQYTLPTPVPANYHPVSKGSHIDLTGKLAVSDGKPLLIHFFNPDCPCSRFNMTHFKSLVKQYNGRLSFAIVVPNKSKEYTEKEIQEKFDCDLPVSFDSSIAGICGVYSTPQAVLLDAGRNLYYRGNYNRSRYCTDKKTNYAQMAIDTLLSVNRYVVLDELAFRSYGCSLPTCKKQ